MGERFQSLLFALQFNRAATVEVASVPLTEDTGALVMREVADQLRLTERLLILRDSRDPSLITHPLSELALSRILLYAQGWRDQDDADTLRHDPALRMAVSSRGGDRPLAEPRHEREPTGLASQPTQSRALMNIFAEADNLDALGGLLLDLGMDRIKAENGHLGSLVLDVDSYPIEAHGRQEGAVYNGHYHKTCLHPNAVFAETGDLLALQVRAGNVHTADDVRSFLEPVLDRAKDIADQVWLRFDSGYASGEFFDWLEERGVRWITRLRRNAALMRHVQTWYDTTREEWAKSRNHDQPRTATREFSYKAGKWSKERRVMAVLVERSNHSKQGELFDNLFFLATDAARREISSEELLHRYRQRGSAEARIGEFVGEIAPKISSTSMARNQATALLGALAYELVHHLRQRLENVLGEGMSLRRVRERVLKVATQVVRHSRRVYFRISESKADVWRLVAQALGPPGELRVAAEGATA